LADFIKTLTTGNALSQKRNVVVLAHSLGSRVALVAAHQLWILEPRHWVSHLVLVQAALPVADLYVGEYSIVIREGGATAVSAHKRRGEFFESLGAAQQVIVTTSAADAVLATAYYARRDLPVVGFGMYPPLHAALGAYGVGKSVRQPHYREIALTPGLLPEASRGHSGLFSGPELIRMLWETISAAKG